MKKITNVNLCSRLKALLYDENFISIVDDNSIEIEEDNATDGKLKKIIIRDIPFKKDGQIIWRINLEEYVTGLSRVDKTKTVEIALVILKDSVLNVYLIEMKTMIKEKGNKSTLLNLKRKIEDSISRFYYLFCMGIIPMNPDECKHFDIKMDWQKFNHSEPKFYGIIFYDKESIKKCDKTPGRMYEILRDQKGLVKCESNINSHKIPLKFFKNPDVNASENCFEINFKDMEF